MTVNRGKEFERVIKRSFEKVPNVSIDRLHDQTTGFKGSQNICDFIVYKEPYEYYIECKTIHGNTFPLRNITETQWIGLLQKSYIKGVYAGIICWWVDRGVTRFIPIQYLEQFRLSGEKSIRYNFYQLFGKVFAPEIVGRKKRVYYEYDMNKFFQDVGRIP